MFYSLLKLVKSHQSTDKLCTRNVIQEQPLSNPYKLIHSKALLKWNSKNCQVPHRGAEKENRNEKRRIKRKNNLADLSPNISKITLNVNGLNTPLKRQISRVD